MSVKVSSPGNQSDTFDSIYCADVGWARPLVLCCGGERKEKGGVGASGGKYSMYG